MRGNHLAYAATQGILRAILLLLLPNKLGMDIYLINQMTSIPLTSNNITCDNTFMHLRKLLRSPMGWRLKRPQLWETTILSLFQPPGVYKQPKFSQIILYRLCFCLDNITASCSWMFATSKVSHIPVIVTTSLVFICFTASCGAVPCSCEPGSAVLDHTSSRDWTPLWYGWNFSLWHKFLLNWARSCNLVPLKWINLCIVPYHSVKVTQFSDTSLKINTIIWLLWYTCPKKSSRWPWPPRGSHFQA